MSENERWRSGASDTIERIETWACSVELPTPLHFGGYSISSREYVAMRVTTSGGMVSDLVTLSRKVPIDVAVHDLFAPRLLGRPGADVEERTDEIVSAQRAVEYVGAAGCAWSMLDIAMWDIRAQVAGAPLWRLLGGSPAPVPVLVVEGYEMPDEGDREFAARLARRADEGFGAIKIEGAGARSPQGLGRRLAATRDAVGPGVELIVDLGWKYPTAQEAIRDISEWKHVELAWVEDAVPRGAVDEAVRLRAGVAHRLGAGDESTRAADMDALLDAGALDVVRLDAATMGGVTSVRRLASRAATLGLRVAPHISPEIHVHLVASSGEGALVEGFPTDRTFDLSHLLIVEPLFDTVSNGRVVPPSAAGIGVQLQMEAVEAFSYRYLESRAP
ncbi:mandelate racemase/muconate lactonizing enzyme family protein [Microbacterium sp.]|uniref:mandelate racemase/muconate lactonizing enzyme family protein n=1 Tax=Microbacterium sp. TaxID=51671 RepID=UPI003F9826DA